MKQLIKEILYAAHECGVCSDWSDKAAEDVLDILKRDGIQEPIDKEELDRLAIKAEKVTFLDRELPFQTEWVEGFKAGYRKAKEIL